MLNIFFVICSVISSQKSFSDFPVDVELLQITKNEEIKFKVTVKNISDNAVNVLKYRRQDYKREKIKALGNYVIEIQKFEDNHYTLFEPSADIGPTFENQVNILFQKGDIITDTLYVDGFSFTRSSENKRGFLTGKYRMRIYFNASMSKCNEINGSKWLEFKIE